ncbi:DUF6468 domain-containing protein [Novosphingobium clariflavum]|uniref:DUF6468 domain-containing protein n=1 Tax=Novosphingobium clariflavum TaxID=2029884 RepID=A0ABV6SCY8_9SPHN|nr:DUF6468 domain-containing protein [Novosphingobium clariflavum]
MNTATMINFTLVPICTAVMVQGWRIDRRMKAFRNAPLTEGVASLERATAQARAVLGELKRVLATDGVAQARTIADAEAMRDELADMVGIGNAVADRIVAATELSAATRKPARKPAAKADTADDAAGEEKVAAKRTTTRRKPVRKAATRTAKPKVAAPKVVAATMDDGVEAAIAAAVAEAKELSAEIVMHPAARANRKRAAA